MRNLSLLFFFLSASYVFGQTYLVSSRNTHSVKMYAANGGYLGDIVPSSEGGLSYPQEVLLHPDGSLLVTGRGNSAIKRYDVHSGNYLGNFTNGYALDNPTKTTVRGDSMLYVSQWGVSQNKIARFDLNSGAFIDEFTSLGINNAGGHAWDSIGNLYVAQYGNGTNGQVLKFDVTGNFLGAFTEQGILAGPVNLWFSGNELMVEDWTHGSVFRFDKLTGNYLSTWVDGLSNAEGFAFDPSGNLLLCDWTQNIVYQADASGNLTPFLVDGGLESPNSILVLSESLAAANELTFANGTLTLYPNPVINELKLSISLKKGALCSAELTDASGMITEKIMEECLFEAGEHLFQTEFKKASGTYFILFRIGEERQIFPVIVR